MNTTGKIETQPKRIAIKSCRPLSLSISLTERTMYPHPHSLGHHTCTLTQPHQHAITTPIQSNHSRHYNRINTSDAKREDKIADNTEVRQYRLAMINKQERKQSQVGLNHERLKLEIMNWISESTWRTSAAKISSESAVAVGWRWQKTWQSRCTTSGLGEQGMLPSRTWNCKRCLTPSSTLCAKYSSEEEETPWDICWNCWCCCWSWGGRKACPRLPWSVKHMRKLAQFIPAVASPGAVDEAASECRIKHSEVLFRLEEWHWSCIYICISR